jgi:hypothetical protein
MSNARASEAACDPTPRASGTDIDSRYLRLALEVGAGEGWDFHLSDISRVEALWRLLDGDATSYGFVVELRDSRRVYFDYDNYDEDGIVERVTMQLLGDEAFPDLKAPLPAWEPAPKDMNRRFAN